MQSLRAKLHRALAYVHAAIEDPGEESLRCANLHAAEVLEAWRSWSVRPELRDEVEQLTVALRTLRQVLAARPETTLDLSRLLDARTPPPPAPPTGGTRPSPSRV